MANSVIIDTAWLQNQLLGAQSLEFDQSTVALTLLALILVPVLASSLFGSSKGSKLPVINPPGPFQLEVQKKFEYVRKGMDYLQEGRRRFPGRPFVLLTNIGPVTILPPARAQEIRNLPTLSFRKAFAEVLPFKLAGFGMFDLTDHPSEITPKVVTKHLTKRLNTVTEPLTLETTFAVKKIMGDNPDWTEIKIYDAVLSLIARLSSRVFLGPEVCRDEEWLDITKNYTGVVLMATLLLRLFPSFVRPLLYWVEPNSRRARAEYMRARRIVEPAVAKRRKERQEYAAKGLPPPVYNDAIEWGDMEAAGAPIDFTDFQLNLAFAAIHTTSDLLTQTLLRLAAEPLNIEPLRAEMLEVLPANGWKKSSLTNLKLLDSAIKEAQRLKPILNGNMVRKVTADTELEGGIVLRKGGWMAVDTGNLTNPALHKDPEKFNIYRFFEMRSQPGGEHKAQLVSPSAEHIAFGYGKYMCPGRFFAANEVKVALCHLLLKYDWKLAPGTSVEPWYFGTDPLINPEARLLYRRRKEEIDLDSLAVGDAAE